MDSVVTQVTAIVGAVTGIAGLLLAAFQAFWDRPRLSLSAYREQRFHAGSEAAHDYIAVLIANSGRRPAIVVSVALISSGRRYDALPGFKFNPADVAQRFPAILNPPDYIVARIPYSRAEQLSEIEVQDSLGKKHSVPRKYIRGIRKNSQNVFEESEIRPD